MGAVSAEITKAMPKPASKILGAVPGQIIAMIGKMSMASITPMPCPASKTLETIVQARENNKTFDLHAVGCACADPTHQSRRHGCRSSCPRHPADRRHGLAPGDEAALLHRA